MPLNVGKEVSALKRMTVRELRKRYAEAFGEETRTGNKAWLIKRVAWRLQSLGEGDLSERARKRAAELANDADVRLSPPEPRPSSPEPAKGHVRLRSNAASKTNVVSAAGLYCHCYLTLFN